MYHQNLSDEAVIRGFRYGNANIIREYFYGYCEVGYNIFNQRYHLSEKENLDFMSLAHQYAIYLMEHDWKPLEDHSPGVSLKSWIINGFRYIVLDALKWYRREYGSISFEDYLRSFDVSSNLRLRFNRMLKDICDHSSMSREDRLIIDLILLKGYKGKEVAEQMGITPAAVSQKYSKLKDNIIIPYFRKYFDLDMEMAEVIVVEPKLSIAEETSVFSSSILESPCPDIDYSAISDAMLRPMQQKRTTPEFISELQPGEIFVFGSWLIVLLSKHGDMQKDLTSS